MLDAKRNGKNITLIKQNKKLPSHVSNEETENEAPETSIHFKQFNGIAFHPQKSKAN